MYWLCWQFFLFYSLSCPCSTNGICLRLSENIWHLHSSRYICYGIWNRTSRYGYISKQLFFTKTTWLSVLSILYFPDFNLISLKSNWHHLICFLMKQVDGVSSTITNMFFAFKHLRNDQCFTLLFVYVISRACTFTNRRRKIQPF